MPEASVRVAYWKHPRPERGARSGTGECLANTSGSSHHRPESKAVRGRPLVLGSSCFSDAEVSVALEPHMFVFKPSSSVRVTAVKKTQAKVYEERI